MTTAHLPIRPRARLAGKTEGYVSYSRRRRDHMQVAARTHAWCRGRGSDRCSIRPIEIGVIFVGKPIRR